MTRIRKEARRKSTDLVAVSCSLRGVSIFFFVSRTIFSSPLCRRALCFCGGSSSFRLEFLDVDAMSLWATSSACDGGSE